MEEKLDDGGWIVFFLFLLDKKSSRFPIVTV